MLVPLPVIAHGAALGRLGGVRRRDAQTSVHRPGGLVQQLHSVDGLAHVAAAPGGDKPRHLLLPGQGQGTAAADNVQGPQHGGQRLLRRQGLELEHRAAGQQGVVHIEIGILRGGGDEGDLAVFHELQQALLLLLVEILDLVQVQQHPVGGQHGVHVRDDGLHILQRRGGGVQVVQGLFRALGNDGGDGGFAGAGGAVEDHVGGGPALDEPPQQGAGAQQVLLPRHLIQGLGPYFVCQWPHGGSLLSCGPGREAPAGEILRYYTTLRRLLHPRFAFFPGVWYNRGRGDLL